MKNSVILLPNFHVRCQEVVKFLLTSHVKIRQDDNIKKCISKISIFPRIIRYDTIYRYWIDISIFSIYRSITSSWSHNSKQLVWMTHSRCFPSSRVARGRPGKASRGRRRRPLAVINNLSLAVGHSCCRGHRPSRPRPWPRPSRDGSD